MFYSQFILAKKGPLGTIWIAAHLERKLRKNQVADTDIGVSVDSIIFPDVPIALRLSSHLLLGVVRIYSRKVGYLFDDCSEALLKVKQAFRSSAVDLPPEESTAPYHSITLPETFDLDDFELPDSEIFQGNYVDHHVSAKEQITLQDTMDGVVYSTSKFGLDERFGDGDACQIGLDLSEEALLGQAATPTNDGAFNDDPRASLSQMTPLEEVDNDSDDIILAGSMKIMSPNHGGFQQADVLDTKPESSEYAEAPATPMLVQEANLSTTQGALVSDDHMDPEPTHGDMEVKEAETKEYLEPTAECGEDGSQNGSLASPSPHPAQEKSMLSVSQCLNGEMKLSGGADGLNNGTDRVERTNMPDGQTEATNCGRLEAQHDIELQSLSMGDGSATKGDVDGFEVCEELKNQDTNSKLQKDEQSKFMQGLHPCNSSIGYQNGSVAEGSEQCFSTDVAEVAVCEIQTIEPALKGKSQTNAGELLDQFYNEALKDISGNGGSSIEPPSPEKLLWASDVIADKQNDLLKDSMPNMEGLEGGMKRISGRKRSLTESAASMQSDSLETFGLSKSRQTKESIPDDDDLLSSILVGRRSSVLKMKPTPAPTEVISKRPRTTQRSAASKRKMLMDETMVLLGDMIKQQLTSTEDLRRVRKKAPCTLSEISMIQRQFLEDEIFHDPILAGISTELFHMHRETYDVSRTKICETDRTTFPAETTEESVKPDVTGESEKGASHLPIRDHGEVLAAETFLQDQNYQDEELVSVSHLNESEMLGARGECSDMLEKMELDEGKAERAEVPSVPTVSDLDMAVPVDAHPEDTCSVPNNLFPEVDMMDKVDIACELHTSPEQSLRKDSLIIHVHTEGADAEQCAHVTQDELRTVGSVDDQSSFPTEHGILPGDHWELSTEPAAIQKEDGPTLAEGNEDSERVGRSGGDAVDEADIESSGLLKHDGSLFEHHTDNASLIGDEETRFCEDMGGRDTDAMDGYQDHENMGIIHDTDFLNVDDDEVNEDDEHQSDAEDSRLLDNSGWSSRTRAVANYLQTLFDREAVRGKSNLPMDSLLVGKTRKEASRMFFESLILKTRDYIQVEQPKPFDNINLKPRSKLMKSQF